MQSSGHQPGQRTYLLPGSKLRIAIGFLTGYAVALIVLSASSGSEWLVILISAGLIGLVPLFLAVLAFFWLEAADALHIWWAMLVGAILCALPSLAISLLPLGQPMTFAVGSETFMTDGQYTLIGAWKYLVVGPALCGLIGAVAGLCGWLVAFGFRYSRE